MSDKAEGRGACPPLLAACHSPFTAPELLHSLCFASIMHRKALLCLLASLLESIILSSFSASRADHSTPSFNNPHHPQPATSPARAGQERGQGARVDGPPQRGRILRVLRRAKQHAQHRRPPSLASPRCGSCLAVKAALLNRCCCAPCRAARPKPARGSFRAKGACLPAACRGSFPR